MSCTLSGENVLSEQSLKVGNSYAWIMNTGQRWRCLLCYKQLQPSFATSNAKADFLKQYIEHILWDTNGGCFP